MAKQSCVHSWILAIVATLSWVVFPGCSGLEDEVCQCQLKVLTWPYGPEESLTRESLVLEFHWEIPTEQVLDFSGLDEPDYLRRNRVILGERRELPWSSIVHGRGTVLGRVSGDFQFAFTNFRCGIPESLLPRPVFFSVIAYENTYEEKHLQVSKRLISSLLDSYQVRIGVQGFVSIDRRLVPVRVINVGDQIVVKFSGRGVKGPLQEVVPGSLGVLVFE